MLLSKPFLVGRLYAAFLVFTVIAFFALNAADLFFAASAIHFLPAALIRRFLAGLVAAAGVCFAAAGLPWPRRRCGGFGVPRRRLISAIFSLSCVAARL